MMLFHRICKKKALELITNTKMVTSENVYLARE